MLRTLRAPITIVAAVLVAVGGFIHLQQWLDVYRDVPTSAPGWVVPRVGFPLNAITSAILAVALLVVALRKVSWKVQALVIGVALAFEVSSLGSLILSRTGSVFGWSEPIWNSAASWTRAVEIGAIAALTLALVSTITAARASRSVSAAL